MAATAGAPAFASHRVEVPATGTHLLILGTMAGAVLRPARMMSGQAIVVDGTPIWSTAAMASCSAWRMPA